MSRVLHSVADVLPASFAGVFPYKFFNLVQSESLEAYQEDINMVVGAPTGSGKTVIFELAICRLISGQSQSCNSFGKVVYLAPIRALCSERAADWTRKFAAFGLVVTEVTGDDTHMSERDLGRVDIICTTPEKWDSITRRGSTSANPSAGPTLRYGVAAQVALLLVDEVHLLHEKRGATLEAVVTRMKLMRLTFNEISTSSDLSIPARNLRIVAASATVPNVYDVASWLQAPRHGVKEFGEEARPVQLTSHVLGYDEKNPWIFDAYLSQRLIDVIDRHSASKPCLVFCPTKKSTLSTSSFLAKQISQGIHRVGLGPTSVAHRLELSEASKRAHDKGLALCVSHGVAYHNGDLSREDRNLVETLFRKSCIRVICTTTTLAQGVNLPAHLVIIKSTKRYSSGSLREYEPSTVRQMIGRAGRPQFGDTGVAVIMTSSQTVTLYKNVLRGASEVIESQLKAKLAEHINAEACRKTVVDFPGLALWLRNTFLWIRMRRNPERYDVGSRDSTFKQREETLTNYGISVVKEMASARLLEFVENESFASTELAGIMMRLQISFETMRLFLSNATELHGEQTILRAVSRSKEISDEFVLRRSDKRILNELSKSVRYPVPGKVCDVDDKAFLLMQSSLEDKGAFNEDPSLRADSVRLIPIAVRLGRCVAEILTSALLRASLTRITSALKVARSIEKRVWWNGDNILKQIPGIGPAFCLQLSLNGINCFASFRNAGPRKLEAVLKKNPPFGNEISAAAKIVPMANVSKLNCHLSGQAVVVELVLVVTSLGRHDSRVCQTSRKKDQDSNEWCAVCIEVGGSSDPAFFQRYKVTVSEEKAVIPVTHSFQLKEKRKAFTVRTLLAMDGFVGADVSKTIPFRVNNDGTLSPLSELQYSAPPVNVKPAKRESHNETPTRGCKHKCGDKQACKHLCCKDIAFSSGHGMSGQLDPRPKKDELRLSQEPLPGGSERLSERKSIVSMRDPKSAKKQSSLSDMIRTHSLQNESFSKAQSALRSSRTSVLPMEPRCILPEESEVEIEQSRSRPLRYRAPDKLPVKRALFSEIDITDYAQTSVNGRAKVSGATVGLSQVSDVSSGPQGKLDLFKYTGSKLPLRSAPVQSQLLPPTTSQPIAKSTLSRELDLYDQILEDLF